MKERARILDIRIEDIIVNILIFILIFGLLKPDSLEYIGLAWLDSMLMAVDVIALVGAAFYILLRNIRVSRVTVAILVMWLVLGVFTALNSREWLEFVKVAGPASLACLLTDCFMQRDQLRFLRVASISLAILYTINLATIVLTYPEGLYSPDFVSGDCYFMGFDNGMPYGLIPMCGYATLYCYKRSGRALGALSCYCFAISLLSVIYVQASTGIISIFFFLFLLPIACSKRFNKIISPGTVFGFFFLATYLLVVLRVQEYFADFIWGLFGKDATLTGRTYLWDYAISQIWQSPFEGTGATISSIPGANGHVYQHPHCLALDLLLKGGILELVAFIAVMHEFNVSYHKMPVGLGRAVILCCIASLLLGEVAGSTQFKALFWGSFALISYCGPLAERTKESSSSDDDLEPLCHHYRGI